MGAPYGPIVHDPKTRQLIEDARIVASRIGIWLRDTRSDATRLAEATQLLKSARAVMNAADDELTAVAIKAQTLEGRQLAASPHFDGKVSFTCNGACRRGKHATTAEMHACIRKKSEREREQQRRREGVKVDCQHCYDTREVVIAATGRKIRCQHCREPDEFTRA